MEPQAYKLITTHNHEVSGLSILSRIIHERAPRLEGINGGFKYDLYTLDFKQGEQMEEHHGRIIRLQQEVNLSGETASPKKFLFQYMDYPWPNKVMARLMVPR